MARISVVSSVRDSKADFLRDHYEPYLLARALERRDDAAMAGAAPASSSAVNEPDTDSPATFVPGCSAEKAATTASDLMLAARSPHAVRTSR
jgi:hypothetical protein